MGSELMITSDAQDAPSGTEARTDDDEATDDGVTDAGVNDDGANDNQANDHAGLVTDDPVIDGVSTDDPVDDGLVTQDRDYDELVHARANDDTLVLPKQPSFDSTEKLAREDPWDTPRVVASTQISGFDGQHRALTTLAWMVPTIVVAGLGLIRTAWPGLDAKELATWGIASLPRAQAQQLLAETEARDLGYHAFIWGWVHLVGASDFALRAPSVIAIALAAGFTAALGCRLATPRVGFLAGLTVAATPSATRFAQDATSTALTVCLGVLATYLLVLAFDRPRPLRYVLYGVVVGLLGLTDPVALVILVAHGALVLAVRARAWSGWLVAALLGSAPAAVLMIVVSAAWSPPRTPAVFDVAAADSALVGVFGGVLVGGMVFGLALLEVTWAKPGVVVTAYALLPLVAVYALWWFVPLDVTDAALLTLPAWACLVGLSLGRRPAAVGLGMLLLISLGGLGAHIHVRQPDGHGQATRDLATTLTANMASGDGIVYGPGDEDGLVGRDIVARYVPTERRPRDVLVTRPPRTNGFLYPAECSVLDRCVGNTKRIWLIRVDTAEDPLQGFPAAKDGLLRVKFSVERAWRFTGLTLFLFVHKPAGPDKPAPR